MNCKYMIYIKKKIIRCTFINLSKIMYLFQCILYVTIIGYVLKSNKRTTGLTIINFRVEIKEEPLDADIIKTMTSEEPMNLSKDFNQVWIYIL